ncbi:Crp/Fnr family transcriptional regulator [Pseudoalteromonas mariniglutinosa]|uniref:Crp/Fnr family transcriptional regulator n=1 Tax=Pseudoalteromonas mariniglutinosa TaxID=206042 RepID=UPI00384D6593
MTATCTSPVVSNHLLNYLPRLEYQWFVEHCTPVALLFGETLNIADEAIKYVYFPVMGGLYFITYRGCRKQSFAMGLIGSEGMLGATLVLENANAAMKSIVLSSGRALRMDAAKFNHWLESNLLVRKLILNYLFVVMQQQLAQTGASNNAYEVKQRLVRWLLMTQDRTHSEVSIVNTSVVSEHAGCTAQRSDDCGRLFTTAGNYKL